MPNNQKSSRQADYGIPPPGYQLPSETHLGAVCLQVSDLPRSIEYYERVVGFRVHDRTSETAALGPQGDDSVLVTLYTRTGVQPARRGAFGLYHFAILLPERAALGRFAAHLTTLDVRVGMADHFVSEALYLWDPDGLGIEVYADRPRSEWRQSGRELVMTTEPLDVARVIAAAGDSRWDGMPAGTVIGHVHLHVGRLDEAARFYHAGLGLDKMVWNYPGALFLAAGGYHHHLGTNTWAPGPAARENEARLLEWELVVATGESSDAAAHSLQAAGYPADREPTGWVTTDPWGTRLRIAPGARATAGSRAETEESLHSR